MPSKLSFLEESRKLQRCLLSNLPSKQGEFVPRNSPHPDTASVKSHYTGARRGAGGAVMSVNGAHTDTPV
jgi:hypothetical protein